jgi:hypothetical protein
VTSHPNDEYDLFDRYGDRVAARLEGDDTELANVDADADAANIDDPNPDLAERSHAEAPSAFAPAVTAVLARALGVARVPGPEDAAFWEMQDAKVANELTARRAKDAAEARIKRAALLRGEDARFPVLAVEHALVATETLAMAHVRKFAAGERRALVLMGGVGAGKTTAATEYALDHGGSAPGFVRASELEARGRYADREAPKGALRDRDIRAWLRTRSMLVLDDLGAEYMDGKGAFRSLLDELLDLFYGDKKRIIITTNLKHARTPPDPKKPPPRNAPAEEPQLAERYGARIMSRLFEIGLRGECGNTDLRRPPPKKG